MNTQSIDEGRLAAEADGALLGVPDDSAPAAPQVGQEGGAVGQGDSLVPFMANAMPIVSLVLLPQWELTEAERKELAESLGQCLDQLFPGGLDGKYACWVRLVVTCGGIAAGRVMQHGRLPGFGPKPLPKVEKASDASGQQSSPAAH